MSWQNLPHLFFINVYFVFCCNTLLSCRPQGNTESMKSLKMSENKNFKWKLKKMKYFINRYGKRNCHWITEMDQILLIQTLICFTETLSLNNWTKILFDFILGDLRGKTFKIARWPKGFFVQPAKTGTVTWEQLVAMLFPLNELQFESLLNCVLFFKLEL